MKKEIYLWIGIVFLLAGIYINSARITKIN